MKEHTYQSISAADLDFRGARAALSTKRLIIDLEELADPEPLIHPELNPDGTPNPKAGQPMSGLNGKPSSTHGKVFRNEVDHCWQAASAKLWIDGKNRSGMIIINGVDEAQAAAIVAASSEGEPMSKKPGALTVAAVDRMLDKATELGVVDFYNSDKAYLQKALTRTGDGTGPQLAGETGLYVRKPSEVVQWIALEGRVSFKGPAASPQTGEHGAVIVHYGPEDMRLVQPKIFLRDYTDVNGNRFTTDDLPPSIAQHIRSEALPLPSESFSSPANCLSLARR